VRSRPIVNSVLVTWMSVVSRVAIVESSSATISSFPPSPCHTAWPRLYMKSATLLELARVPGFNVMLDATVNTSKSKNTTNVPSKPPDRTYSSRPSSLHSNWP